MKKIVLWILRHIATSSILRGTSFVFRKLKMDKISSAFEDASTAALFAERYERKWIRLYFKYSYSCVLVPSIGTIISIAVGNYVPLIFVFSFLVGILISAMQTNGMLIRFHSRHTLLCWKYAYSFIERKNFDIDVITEKLKDPRLYSHQKSQDTSRIGIQRQQHLAHAQLYFLEQIGSPIIKEMNDNFEKNNNEEAWKILYSNYPETHGDMRTEFSPVFIQCDNEIYFMTQEDYPKYLRLFMAAYEKLPRLIDKEDVGDFVVSESGSIEEKK